jgi:hypothetical protein
VEGEHACLSLHRSSKSTPPKEHVVVKLILVALAVAALAVPVLATGVAQASSTTPPGAKRVGPSSSGVCSWAWCSLAHSVSEVRNMREIGVGVRTTRRLPKVVTGQIICYGTSITSYQFTYRVKASQFDYHRLRLPGNGACSVIAEAEVSKKLDFHSPDGVVTLSFWKR